MVLMCVRSITRRPAPGIQSTTPRVTHRDACARQVLVELLLRGGQRRCSIVGNEHPLAVALVGRVAHGEPPVVSLGVPLPGWEDGRGPEAVDVAAHS